MDPQKLVEHFSMSPHPEGGFFCRDISQPRSNPRRRPARFRGTRNFSTGILFLLRRENIPICTG